MMLLRSFVLFGLVSFLNGDGGLGSPCVDNQDCVHIVDAKCSSGVCICSSDTVQYKGSCLKVSEPERLCDTNWDCKEINDQRRVCVAGQCRCIPLHHVVGGICIRNRGLRELCTSDDECYWGQDMIDTMECRDNLCSCKVGFKSFDKRQCIPMARGYLPRAVDTVLNWFH